MNPSLEFQALVFFGAILVMCVVICWPRKPKQSDWVAARNRRIRRNGFTSQIGRPYRSNW